MRSPMPLAPFAYTWVGGDIHGLSAFAGTMYGYVPQMQDVVTALDRSVGTIAGDAGWQGSAAQAFTSNWEVISAETNAVGLVTISAAEIVDQLAVGLSRIENALEQAAQTVAAHGVPVGSDGRPPPVDYADPAREQWREAYDAFYQQCMQQAEEARIQAAGALQKLHGAIMARPRTSIRDSTDGGSTSSDGVTIGDYLADLLAAPTAYSNQVADRTAELDTQADEARQTLNAARRAAQNHTAGRVPDSLRKALSGAETELAAAKQELAAAEQNENGLSSFFGTRLSDMPGIDGVRAGELGDMAVLRAALDVPVVDVLAGSAATIIGAQDDMAEGMPAQVAYPAEAGATGLSIAAAAGTMALIGDPVTAVPVATAGIVAYGVGDYLHNYTKDAWADTHRDGPGGMIQALPDAAGDTGTDMEHLVSSIWKLATTPAPRPPDQPLSLSPNPDPY